MIGIIQGRLSKAPKNRLQYFPKKWNLEFKIAKECNYQYIEFFSERKFNIDNPIWKKNFLKDYVKLAKENNLKIYSFVDDYIISNSIYKKKNLEYLKRLIKNLSFINVKKLILPLYGKSILKKKNIQVFIKSLEYICTFAAKYKIQILLESNVSPDVFFLLKKKIKKNLNLVIDTGNRINLKRNLYDDIFILAKFIKHIHIKDKNDLNENVVLGKGNVDFDKLFFTLNKIKYKGHFTIESTKNKNPKKTSKKKFEFFKKKIT